jgi:hypothetical protein
MIFRTARWVASDATFSRAHDHEAREDARGPEEKSYPFAGCTFIQWRAISSRVATHALGFDAT